MGRRRLRSRGLRCAGRQRAAGPPGAESVGLTAYLTNERFKRLHPDPLLMVTPVNFGAEWPRIFRMEWPQHTARIVPHEVLGRSEAPRSCNGNLPIAPFNWATIDPLPSS